MRKRIVELIMACVLLVCFLLLSKEAVEVLRAKEQKPVLVVDCGHGGMDPGVVGCGNVLEKDINLAIALKLRECLKAAGYEVLMTREEDKGLYEEGTSNKKKQDMENRVKFVNEANALLTISIHQNSYPDETICGPQVFFHETSSESRKLAETLQKALNEKLQVQKPREIKSNVSYYLLKNVKGTIAIVECGFLTNPAEAVALQQEEYQQKIAEAVTEAVCQYLGKEKTIQEEENSEENVEKVKKSS